MKTTRPCRRCTLPKWLHEKPAGRAPHEYKPERWWAPARRWLRAEWQVRTGR